MQLLRRVSAAPELQRFTVGAVNGYRNAASHGHTFALEDETIVFRLRTFQQRVPISRFLDDAFAIIESVSAVQLVIDGFLAQQGYEDHEVSGLGPFEPDLQQFLTMIMEENGVELVEYAANHMTCNLTVQRLDPEKTLFSVLYASRSILEAEHMVISEHDGETLNSLSVPMAALNEYAENIDEPVTATVRAMLLVEYNGKPLLSGDRLRAAAGGVGFKPCMNGAFQIFPFSRALRQRAIDGGPGLRELLRTSMRMVAEGGARQSGTGSPCWYLD